jgi:hypothetical protein
MDVGILPNYLNLVSISLLLIYYSAFIFQYYEIFHGIRANRLTPIVRFWVKS